MHHHAAAELASMKAEGSGYGGRVAVLILSMLLMCVQVCSPSNLQSECRFVYTQQPSSGLTCTPEVGWFHLVCEVQSRAELEQRFGVVWFGLQVGEAVPMVLNGPSHSVHVQTVANRVMSNLTVSLPLNADLNQLFCQIRLDDGTLLQPSQPLILNSPSPLPVEPCGPASLINTTHMCVAHSAVADQMVATGPTSPSSPQELSVAFYAVVAVIIVFALIIVTLSIIVVFMYQRKCGRSEVSSSIDGDGGANACNGHELNRTTSPVPQQQEDSQVITGRYTREPLSTESPPPRPPKPSSHNVLPPHRLPKEGAVDIYRTLEGSETEREAGQTEDSVVNNRHPGKIKFKVLDSITVGDYERSPTYQCSSQVVKATPAIDSLDNKMYVEGGTAGQDKDLPNVGVHVSKDVLGAKYSGDYERDPNYMSRLVANQLLTYQIPTPGEVLGWEGVDRQGLGSEQGQTRTDKYRGDYERCETYVLPPLKTTAAGERANGYVTDQADGGNSDNSKRQIVLDSKYAGNYERNPVYMENLLRTVSTEQASSAIPPGHGYTTLEPTSIEPHKPYTATLTADCKEQPLPPNSSGKEQPLPPSITSKAQPLPPNTADGD